MNCRLFRAATRNRPSRRSINLRLGLRLALLAVVSVAAAGCVKSEQEVVTAALPAAGERAADCAGCHQEQTRLWQSSHHAKAMQIAAIASTGQPQSSSANHKSSTALGLSESADAVLGDFADATARHFDLQGQFSVAGGAPVMTLSRGTNTSRHVITHTFGVTPLQQYLTLTQSGKTQVLPFAWDSRSLTDGGQRWITLFPTEDIKPGDRLHWQAPLANWNGMCADCHSTGLKRSYDSATNSFASTFSAVNVACGSCHGDDPHSNNPIAAGSSVGFTARYPLPTSTQLADITEGTATASKKTMEICAACHSLRAPLVDGINPTHAYLDQFSPSLLDSTLYFPDGQIRAEVYVWGSFQQSRMHAEGVTCGNCHEPHSQTLKATGNALCGQCHVAAEFDTPDHHQHPAASSGAQCANCHMPARTYMVVDDRRDHSFRVPDLVSSKALGTPDACTSCHQDQTIDWALASLKPSANNQAPQAPQEQRNRSRQLWQNNQAGMPLSAAQFAQIQSAADLPELLRASAISQQARLRPGAPLPNLQALVESPEPLIALAAVQSLQAMPAAERATLLAPLLGHRYRAIRVAAANQLRDVASNKSATNPALTKALAEADVADATSAWRGEGIMNQALNRERSGDTQGAVAAYRRAIATEPNFAPAYINLTELYRRLGDTAQEQRLYAEALSALPNSAVLRYSYALHLVRSKNPAAAAKETQRALASDPQNASAAYLHLLLLDNIGQTQAGVGWLRTQLTNHKNSPQVLQLGAKQAQTLGDAESLHIFIQALEQR